MTRRRSAAFDALVGPFDGALRPLGYKRGRLVDSGWGLRGAWQTGEVEVVASFEPREDWGDVTVGRRIQNDAASASPFRSPVFLDDILRARGLATTARKQKAAHVATPDEISTWAEQAAQDLLKIQDRLAGRNLQLLDRLVAAKPGLGGRSDSEG